MKKTVLFTLLALCVPFFAHAAQSLPTGKVNVEDFLNVRLGPGLKNPVTGRLKGGQTVSITRICGNWLELAAPETLPVYISEARVNPEGKLTGELNMRCRMDVKAPTYGLLPAGSVVKRLNERANGWVRIAPPATLRVYVAAVCVLFDRNQFDDKGMPLNAKTPAEAEKKIETAEKPAAPAPTPAAETKLEGVLIKWKYAKTPEMSYALLDKPDGKNQAFIIPDNDLSPAAFENKTVVLNGSFVKEENNVKFFKAISIVEKPIPAKADTPAPAPAKAPEVKPTAAASAPNTPPPPAADPVPAKTENIKK